MFSAVSQCLWRYLTHNKCSVTMCWTTMCWIINFPFISISLIQNFYPLQFQILWIPFALMWKGCLLTAFGGVVYSIQMFKIFLILCLTDILVPPPPLPCFLGVPSVSSISPSLTLLPLTMVCSKAQVYFPYFCNVRCIM